MAEPTTTLPSVADQFAAVLNAPLPFLLALAAVAYFVWRAFEWRYAGVIEKTRSLWELAEHDAAGAKKRETDLKETVQELTDELSNIREDAEPVDKRAFVAALEKAKKAAAELGAQMQELEQANNAVSDTVRRGAVSAGVVSRGPGATVIVEEIPAVRPGKKR
jgi:hypothetical protein